MGWMRMNKLKFNSDEIDVVLARSNSREWYKTDARQNCTLSEGSHSRFGVLLDLMLLLGVQFVAMVRGACHHLNWYANCISFSKPKICCHNHLWLGLTQTLLWLPIILSAQFKMLIMTYIYRDQDTSKGYLLHY